MNETNEKSIYSEEVHEIITKPPSWLLRNGIILVLIIIINIILLSLYIQYPDKISTTISIDTNNQSSVIKSKYDTFIKKILIPESTWVDTNTEIAYLMTDGDHKQIISLLNYLYNKRIEDILPHKIVAPSNLSLGDLQSNYYRFYNFYQNYLLHKLKYKDSTDLALAEFINNASLWKQKHVITSHNSGIVIYYGLLKENKKITADEPLIFIKPKNVKYYGEVPINPKQMSKIKLGQEVSIKLTNEGYNMANPIKGIIVKISKLPDKDGMFYAKVDLLLDSLNIFPGMRTSAEVVVDKRSLFYNFFLN